MGKFTRLLLLTLLTAQVLIAFADRGTGKKKSKISVNVRAGSTFSGAIANNLRAGLRYSGSLQASGTTATQNSFLTYTKGNNIYIMPYKQKMFVADAGRGYAGTKLIIRHR